MNDDERLAARADRLLKRGSHDFQRAAQYVVMLELRRENARLDKVLETDDDGNHTGNGICPYCEARWKDGLVVSPVA